MANAIDVYLREIGVICYCLPILPSPETRGRQLPESLREMLLNSKLEWYWHSEGEASPRDSTEPGTKLFEQTFAGLTLLERPLAVVSAESIQRLSNDVEATDANDIGRLIALFGADRGAASYLVDEYKLRLREALEHFAAYEGGPIRIAIIAVGDDPDNFVFVPHSPLPEVQMILDSWGSERQDLESIATTTEERGHPPSSGFMPYDRGFRKIATDAVKEPGHQEQYA